MLQTLKPANQSVSHSLRLRQIRWHRNLSPMKKLGACPKICAAALVFYSLCLLSMCGQEVTLSLNVVSNTVNAGNSASVWLNALNASDREISWTFPPRIESKITAPQGTFKGSLALRLAESPSVVIAPGTFVRREYVAAMPAAVAGQVVLEFPGLNVNRAVLDVPPPGAVAHPAAEPPDSFFTRFIAEPEPAVAGKGSGPGIFFKEHIAGYEPFYFIAGSKSPDAKFQISFAYQLLNNEGSLAEKAPALKGFNLAYTQTSLWDWSAESAPFYDTSYKPEFFYAWNNITHAQPTNWFLINLQGGMQHESNGQDGVDSRSLNNIYFQPRVTFGPDDSFQLTLQPRVWAYVGDLSENPDIADYYGYVNLRTIVGWKRGLQLSAIGTMGKDANHGSVQLDLTYPTMRLFGSFSLYLQVQYFNGYGESLIGYNQRTDVLRVGFALFR